MISLFITLCKMVSVRSCLSVAEEVERYMVPKSRFGSFGQDPLVYLFEPKHSLKTPSGEGKKQVYKQHQQKHQ